MNVLRRTTRGDLTGSDSIGHGSSIKKGAVPERCQEDPVKESSGSLEHGGVLEEKGIMKASNLNIERNNSNHQKADQSRSSKGQRNSLRKSTSTTKEPKDLPTQPSQPQQEARKSRSNNNSRIVFVDTKKAAQEAVDSYNMSMYASPSKDKQIHLPSDIYRNLANSTRNSRKSKKSIAPLPTLDEAMTEEDESTAAGSAKKEDEENKEPEEGNSFDSWDESNLSFDADPHQQPQQSQEDPPAQQTQPSLDEQQQKIIQPTVMQLMSMDDHRKACDQIKSLMDDARRLATEGKEEDAISVYRRALILGRQDVARVKSQLSKKTSVRDQFYDNWIEIGVFLADIRVSQANMYERLLDYGHAVACIQEAVSIHNRQVSFYKTRNKEKALASLKLIQALETTEARFQNAGKLDSKRKQLQEQVLQFQKDAAGAATNEEKRNAYQQMQDTAQQVKALETKVFGEQHPLVADANSLLGAIALEQGNTEEAIASMKLALAIMKKSLGMKHPRTGTKLLHLASIYAAQGQDDMAIDHYQMAIAVFRSCKALKLVGSTLNDVAVIHIRRKEFEKAIQLLEESLEAYKSEESSWDTAQVWRNLGECHCQRKDYAKGVTALKNALKVQREGRAFLDKAVSSEMLLDNMPPLHLVDDASIADTLRRLGKAYFGARMFEPALSNFKEACIIHKAEVKKVVHVSRSRANLSLPARQDELAQTIYCMAELYDHMGDYQLASKLFSESLQLRLFSDAHKESRSNMVHCAMCLYGLGGIHLKRLEFDEAVDVIQQALSYCEAHGVPENNVIYAMIKARLDEAEKGSSQREEEGEAVNTSADSSVSAGEDSIKIIEDLEIKAAKAIRDGNVDAAIWILSAVMQQRKELLRILKEKGDKATSVKYDTACTLFTFGKVLVVRGDRESAEKAFKDALRLFKKSGTSADSTLVVQLCEELEKLMKEKC